MWVFHSSFIASVRSHRGFVRLTYLLIVVRFMPACLHSILCDNRSSGLTDIARQENDEQSDKDKKMTENVKYTKCALHNCNDTSLSADDIVTGWSLNFHPCHSARHFAACKF